MSFYLSVQGGHLSHWGFISFFQEDEKRVKLSFLNQQFLVVVGVQSLSPVQLFATPWTAACLPCPSLFPRVFSNSCPLSQWFHPTISSSVTHFSCHQSFPTSESFPVSQLFHIRWPKHRSFSFTSVFPMSIQGLFSLGVTGLILQSKGLSRAFSMPQSESISSSVLNLHYGPTSYPYMTIGKATTLIIWTFVRKVMSLLLNMLSRLIIAFLSRSKHLLVSWLESPSAVILEPKKMVSISISSPSVCHEMMGLDAEIFIFF